MAFLWPFMAKYSFDWTCIVFSRGHKSKFIWSCPLCFYCRKRFDLRCKIGILFSLSLACFHKDAEHLNYMKTSVTLLYFNFFFRTFLTALATWCHLTLTSNFSQQISLRFFYLRYLKLKSHLLFQLFCF